MAISIITGQDKVLIVRLQNGTTTDPYDLSTADLVEACFTKADGTKLDKYLISGLTGGLSGTDTIVNVTKWTDLVVGQLISGTGIPAGATIIALPSSGTVQLSVAATATATGVALTIGDIQIISPAVLGKIKISLTEADTASLETGDSESFEVKVRVGGIVSIVQFLAALQVIQSIC